jgi:signal transduction histidine kinase
VKPLFLRSPGFIAAVAIFTTILIWGVCLVSITKQVGGPFPGFYYSPDRIVSAFTPRDFTGWQAGLQPWDRILAVNGLPWQEMHRVVQEAPIGSILIYSVERDNRVLNFAVPTMEFQMDIVWRFIPGWLFFSLTFLITGLFVYTHAPDQWLNRYLLLYLLAWACGIALAWEYYLSQQKLSAYFLQPWIGMICTAGWIFFWSFPADQTRNRFLTNWPLIPAFISLAVLTAILFPLLFFMASKLDRPEWWYLYSALASWGSFLIFGGGSLFNKFLPLILISRRENVSPLIRRQAVVLFAGIGIGLGGFIVFVWVPVALHIPPPANPQWGAFITLLYPLSIAYAVLRYRLFNPRKVVRKGMVYSLLTAALTAIFLLLSLSSGYLFQLLTGEQSILAALLPALLVAFLFQPARTFIQSLVDRAFFRQEIEIGQALARFNQGLSVLKEKREIANLVKSSVKSFLGVNAVTLWLFEGGSYCPVIDSHLIPRNAEWPLAAWMTNERQPVLLTNSDTSPMEESMREIGAVVAFPLWIGERLLGILALDEKRSGELYSQDDIELLMNLTHGTALAMENARLHDEKVVYLKQRLAEVAAAQEEERKRIAQELHDGIGPDLASLKVRLHMILNQLELEHHLVADEVLELAELAQASIQDIRGLIYDLRPTALDHLGLAAALRDYVSRWQNENGLTVILTLSGEEIRLGSELEVALFRLVQESLANVVKHSAAHTVEICLEIQNCKVQLSITDDGCGFDSQEALLRARKGGHLGLWSMRERIELLDGLFEVESQPGRGTRIFLEIPIYAHPSIPAEQV